nr:hypothetical protein CFP56_49584 [Quercus suber]
MKKWRFIGFYGHLETRKREESWKLMENLSHRSDLPWICMGDYSEIMYANEKEGGRIWPEGQFQITVFWYSKNQASQENRESNPRCGVLNLCGWRMWGAMMWYLRLGKEVGARFLSGRWKYALGSVRRP